MGALRIRAAARADIPAWLTLDRSSRTSANWSERQHEDLFSTLDGPSPRLALVAENEPATLIGFLVARHIAPEWELENLLVSPAERRHGVANQLLQALLSRAAQTNSEAVFLEVRESNAPARLLYEKFGFQQTGRRKSYYSNPFEDAILYRFTIP